MIYGEDDRGRSFLKSKSLNEINFEIILGKDDRQRNKLMKKEIIESLKLFNKRILVFSKNSLNYLLEDEYKYDIRFFSTENYLEGIDRNLKILKDPSKKVYIYIDDEEKFESVIKEMFKLRIYNNFITVAINNLKIFEDPIYTAILQDKHVQFVVLSVQKEDYYIATKIMERDMPLNIDFANIIDFKLQDMTGSIYVINTEINNGYVELYETNYLEKEYRDYFKERNFPILKGPRIKWYMDLITEDI